ncbi:hypothetical protein M3Y97_01062800 [Aphelenchoides bicaudatus]|nr:hypothetical protein M3Y97_01062800 [Aphelenchoides bicaudatus]
MFCFLVDSDVWSPGGQCNCSAIRALLESWKQIGRLLDWTLTLTMTMKLTSGQKDDCMVTKNIPKINCQVGCFFATYALDNLDYAVVRGCVEDFAASDAINRAETCKFATSPNVVVVDDEIVQSPLVGWYTCFEEDNCNNDMIVDHELATKPSKWYLGNKQCEEPVSRGNCLSCQEFDGSGKCSHKTKSTCMGNYCTTITGKVNGRRFEKRGCAPLDPLDLQTCKEVKHDLVIEQFSGTLRQSYHSKTCVCQGDRCNSDKAAF